MVATRTAVRDEEETTLGGGVGHTADHLAEKAKENVVYMGEKAEQYYKASLKKAKEIEEKLSKSIRRNPMRSMLIAVGVAAAAGVLIGWMTRRGSTGNGI